jgi:uncharacterized caspase-like protein
MSKRQHVMPAQSQRRIFPTEYTRKDLIEYATELGAECYALAERVRELEAQLDEPVTDSRRSTRVHAPESPGIFRQ